VWRATVELAVIYNYFERATTQQSDLREDRMGSSVLIIEDDDTSMDLMIFLLNSMGLLAIPALNGPAGLAIAKSQSPALILCDIQMPHLDGMAIIRHLKSDPDLCQIPVVAVTAMAMEGDEQRLRQAGFDGYLGKPIDIRALTDTLLPHLNKRR
jgi:CheY-like chemotaxis protein